jgi:hypothetical protein
MIWYCVVVCELVDRVLSVNMFVMEMTLQSRSVLSLNKLTSVCGNVV